MQIWLYFWILIFWISIFNFLINSSNFINLFFFAEVIWLILYVIVILLGSINDDLNECSLTFFILGLAGLEYSVGFILIINFKLLNINLNLLKNEKSKNNFFFNNNKINFLKSFWNK